MAEIKREPIKITVGDVDYDAFDDNHTLMDVLRYAKDQGADRGEFEWFMKENFSDEDQ